MRRLHFITFICCMALIALCLAASPGSDIESRVEAFQAEMDAISDAAYDEDNWHDHRDELKAAYEHWFPVDSLGPLVENAEKSELTDLFFATLNYAIDVGRKSERAKVEAVFAGLEERGWADDRIIGYMHKCLLSLHLFDEAQAFRQAHPQVDLPVPPPIISPSGAPGDNVRTVLRSIKNGSALERQILELESSSQVIVIGHPGCHFCQDAVAAITADPEVATVMSAAAIWLTSPLTSMTDGSVAEWNRENPAYAYYYAESKTDWPEVSWWGTPSFYFMKDGELVKKLVGWPEGGRMEDLRAGLRAIGIAVEE